MPVGKFWHFLINTEFFMRKTTTSTDMYISLYKEKIYHLQTHGHMVSVGQTSEFDAKFYNAKYLTVFLSE